jgi:hypothetical protein
VEKEEELIGFE